MVNGSGVEPALHRCGGGGVLVCYHSMVWCQGNRLGPRNVRTHSWCVVLGGVVLTKDLDSLDALQDAAHHLGAQLAFTARVVALNKAPRLGLVLQRKRNDEAVEARDVGKDDDENHSDKRLWVLARHAYTCVPKPP